MYLLFFVRARICVIQFAFVWLLVCMGVFDLLLHLVSQICAAYVCMCVYMHVHKDKCVYMFVCVYIYIYMYMYLYMYMYMQSYNV